MIGKIGIVAALAVGCASLAGCNTTSQTAITSAICVDAVTLQGSGLALNKPETTALNGLITACNATAGGTQFNNATVALAIINDAILLQSSGLLKDIHITAEVTAPQRLAVKKIDMDYAKAKAFGLVK
jgi:predicted small secreted protein